jgi:uncharacterized protein (TIGR04222 family)
MAGFDPFHPIHLAALVAVWLALFVAAVVLGLSGRRRARDHRLPMDAPADLDVYGLACLAGGAGRLRDTALARLLARGVLRLERRGREAVLDGDLPADAHPVEAAVYEAIRAQPRRWLQTCHEASVRLAVTYRQELLRQDLLVDPARSRALLPALALWSLALTLSVLTIVAVARHPLARPGQPGRPGLTEGLFVAFGLGFAACCLGLSLTMGPLYRNRRGDHVLAEAVRSHPARPGLDVALFGLHGRDGDPALEELYAVLYPPAENTGG